MYYSTKKDECIDVICMYIYAQDIYMAPKVRGRYV